MGYIIIDIFIDEQKAKSMKDKHEAMEHKVELRVVKGITVNECLNGCIPKYEKDANPVYVLIAESK